VFIAVPSSRHALAERQNPENRNVGSCAWKWSYFYDWSKHEPLNYIFSLLHVGLTKTIDVQDPALNFIAENVGLKTEAKK
jgi:hypothetical protein